MGSRDQLLERIAGEMREIESDDLFGHHGAGLPNLG
jgi:hypothetical protein